VNGDTDRGDLALDGEPNVFFAEVGGHGGVLMRRRSKRLLQQRCDVSRHSLNFTARRYPTLRGISKCLLNYSL